MNNRKHLLVGTLTFVCVLAFRGQSLAQEALSSSASATAATPDQQAPVVRRGIGFKFTKVDLELLRQVNAFDKYMEEKGWLYSDPASNEYLNKLGLSLVPKETLENVTWQFR